MFRYAHTTLRSLAVLLLLGGSHAPAQEAVPAAEPEVHTYSVADSGSLRAYVFRPASPGRGRLVPAIVIFHGGGWAFGSPEWAFSRAKHFARRGMVAIAVQYRLSDQKSVTPLDAVDDAKSAIRWTRANAGTFGVDPKRIVAYGWSAGAHLAASAAIFRDSAADTPTSSAPDVIILVSPAVSLQADGWFRRLLGQKASVKEVNPIEHVKKGLPPTLILQGDTDTVTPAAGAQEFCQRLRSASNKCEIHIYKGFGHLFTPAGIPDNNEPRPDPRTEADAFAKADRFLVKLGYMK